MWTGGPPFSRWICSQYDIRQGQCTLKRNTCRHMYSFNELCIISFSLRFFCVSHALLNLAKCESCIEIRYTYSVYGASWDWYTLWERKQKNTNTCIFLNVILLFGVSFVLQRTFAFNSMLFPPFWTQVELDASFCALIRVTSSPVFAVYAWTRLRQPIHSFLGFRCFTSKQFSAFFTGIILLWM